MPARTRSKKEKGAPVKGGGKGRQPYRRPAAATASEQPKGDATEAIQASNLPLCFWREIDPATGWLSQWYMCDFTDEDGVVYKSAEHYMMYQKAVLFNDLAVGEEILAAEHPRQVKALGRKVSNFDDDVWRAHREDIVRRGTVLKFTRAVSEEGLRRGVSDDAPLIAPLSLRELLLSTGNREIVEASPLDRIWGVGFGAAKAEANRGRWGLNLLGKALMSVREELRKDEESEA